MRVLIAIMLWISSAAASGAQFVAVDDHEVHYVLVNTLFLDAEIAHRYGITRAKDRAIVNLSVIGPDQRPRDADVTGTVRNLIGQQSELEFRRIVDGDAIYFIAPVRFTDQDVLRFEVEVATKNGPTARVSFQERMWVDSKE